MKKLLAMLLVLVMALTMCGSAFAADGMTFYGLGLMDAETGELTPLPFALNLIVTGEDTLVLIGGENETEISGTYAAIEGEENSYLATINGQECAMMVEPEAGMVGIDVPDLGLVLFSATAPVTLAEVNTEATLEDFNGTWTLVCAEAYGMTLDAETVMVEFAGMGLTSDKVIIENGDVYLMGDEEAMEMTMEEGGLLAKRSEDPEMAGVLDVVLALHLDGMMTVELMGMTMVFEASSAPVITAQPESQTASKGDMVDFTVEAEGEGLTYQWQYCAAESTTWKNSSKDGNTTMTLTIKATVERDGQQYRCVVTDANGVSVTSEAATLTLEK